MSKETDVDSKVVLTLPLLFCSDVFRGGKRGILLKDYCMLEV